MFTVGYTVVAAIVFFRRYL